MHFIGALSWSQTVKTSVPTASHKKNARKPIKNSSKQLKTQHSRKAYVQKSVSPQVAYYKRAETLSQNTSITTQSTLKEDKILSGSLGLIHSQSLIDHQDGTKSMSRMIIGSVNTKINPNWGLLTRIAFEEDLRNNESAQDGFSDLSFRLRKVDSKLAYWITGAPSFTLVFPTSEYSSKYQNLQASMGAAYNLTMTPEVLAPGFETSMSIGLSRNFHKYETDVNHKILNQYTLRETFSGGYSYSDWTFSAEMIFRHGWNYEGSTTQSFEHSQEVGYSLLKNWNVSMGHTNSGAWFRPNGQDSNLKLINEDDSIFYLSTSLKF